jgi:hypothetical protein
MTRFRINRPGEYVDRLGRTCTVEGRATHNATRWVGIAGDGGGVCWETCGIVEMSKPSSIDIVGPKITASSEGDAAYDRACRSMEPWLADGRCNSEVGKIMTDTVSRQAVIGAIEALSPDGLKPKGVGLVANITIKKALAAINAIPAVDEWQPIETAPKDGTVVILFNDENDENDDWSKISVGVFDHSIWHCIYSLQTEFGEFGMDTFVDCMPTHWRPLPNPPLLAALGE